MSDREQKIIEEYENLGEDDFLADGIRPKVSAMEALTEIDDLSRAEIDEVLADKYEELEAEDEEPEEEDLEAEEEELETEPVPAPPSGDDDASSSSSDEGEKEILCVQDKKIMGGIRVTKYVDHSTKTEKLG